MTLPYFPLIYLVTQQWTKGLRVQKKPSKPGLSNRKTNPNFSEKYKKKMAMYPLFIFLPFPQPKPKQPWGTAEAIGSQTSRGPTSYSFQEDSCNSKSEPIFTTICSLPALFHVHHPHARQHERLQKTRNARKAKLEKSSQIDAYKPSSFPKTKN